VPRALRVQLLLPGLLLAAALAHAAGPAPDWNAVSEVEEVTALTRDADGSPRETTVWLAVVDGQGYLRTSGSTRWGDDVEREGALGLRIGETEYRLRAVLVEDPALRERVVGSFREKYGWVDGLLNVVRGSHPRIMRLEPGD
jgi:hypothetical protein